ncbi:chemotaxis protein CheX [Nocardioides sp. R-C-SC26]|uniref:chemotaxis protein CheX n=1 Tax=Nocardioides sp. R-C-SC26 TaxID=2870414 RepID=UPI001E3A392B|nr:chemotaxis protein CheX [Nocardioides sp. R-C-SC26]
MSTSTAELSMTHVHAVVEEVWTTFLGGGDPLYEIAPPTDRDPAEQGSVWDAAITVTGAWQAAIVICLPDGVADAVTRAMLGFAPEDHLAPEDLIDALGELVNVIGGNIKSLMPGPSKLSLPLVARGPISPSTSLVEACRLDLGWGPHSLRVVVSVPADQDRDQQAEEA